MHLIQDDRTITPEELSKRPHAKQLSFQEVIDLLCSPDTGLPLRSDPNLAQLTDGTHFYPLKEDLPLLIPTQLLPFFSDRLQVPANVANKGFLQYFLLASIKQSGEINAAPAETAAQKHFFRLTQFLKECRGSVLDIGCDDAELGASFFPAQVQYVGLDPFCTRSYPFRIVGLGEYLPFQNETLDNVIFNTSLDHIFDWRRALNEAKRVLKHSGQLYITSYIWTDRADLINDTVHFHHFRLYELKGALEELNFSIQACEIYESPKGDTHRHGLYLKATRI